MDIAIGSRVALTGLTNERGRRLNGLTATVDAGSSERATVPTCALEHLECGQQPHVQDRGAKKRTQLAGRSGSGWGLESPSPGGARSQGHNTSPRDSSVYRVTP